MLRRSFRVGLWLGLLGGATVAVLRALQKRPEPIPAPWPPAQPWPSPAAPEPRVTEPAAPEIVEPEPEPAAEAGPWVDPDGRICPTTHPVKVKLASKLFHLPGMFAYNNTNPDRCYRDAAAAEADGFQKAKR